MTCIVGIEHDGIVFLGSDTCASNTSITLETDEPKIVRINKDMIVGYCGSFRFGQLMQYSIKLPSQPKQMSDHEYLCTLFVDTLRKTFKEKGFLQIEKHVEEGGTALIAYKHKLYYLEDTFQVRRAIGYGSVGSGSYFAMGSLATTAETKYQMGIIDRLMDALKVASKLNPFVKGPYHYATSNVGPIHKYEYANDF